MNSLTKYLLAAMLALPTIAHGDIDWPDNYRPVRAVATASQTTFTYTFPTIAENDLRVYLCLASADCTTLDGWVLKTLSTHYTVTGEGLTAGGTVIFNSGLASGDLVVIERDDGIDRTTDLVNLSVTGINEHIDKTTGYDQQTEDIARRRAIQPHVSDDYNNGDGDTWIRNILPPVSDDVEGDALCIIPKADPADGYRATFCKGAGGGVCADCPPGVCDGGDNDGEECQSEEDCPGGECVGFEDCDFVGVDDDGVYFCGSGCPADCGGGECVEGVCTNSADACTTNDDCVPGGCIDCGPTGRCEGGENDGAPCTSDAQCPDGECEFDDDVCFGGIGDGDPCTNDVDCDGLACRPNDNVCFGGSEDREPCTLDGDCPGLCDGNSDCVGGPTAGDACAVNTDCVALCVHPNDRCDGCDAQISEFVCLTGSHVGEACETNTDCTGKFAGVCGVTDEPCGDCGGLCATNADCGDACECDVDNICLGGPNDGDGCTDDTDCAGTCTAGACVHDAERECTTNTDCGGVCAPEFVDEVCQGGPSDGDPCTRDIDCCPGGDPNHPECGYCERPDEVGVRSSVPVVNRAVPVYDGTTGAFITDSRVTIGTTGFVRNVRGLDFVLNTETGTGQRVTWSPPYFHTASSAAQRNAMGAWYEFPRESVEERTREQELFPEEAQVLFSAASADYALAESFGDGLTPTFWYGHTYPLHISKAGVGTDGEKIATIPIAEHLICPDDFAGSIALNTVAFADPATYDIQRNNTTIGTIVFDTGAASEGTPNTNTFATTGTCTAAACVGGSHDLEACGTNTDCGELRLAPGDWVDIEGPATADATGAKLGIVLKCYRSQVGEIEP